MFFIVVVCGQYPIETFSGLGGKNLSALCGEGSDNIGQGYYEDKMVILQL
jgi:hypothetical protein